MKIWRIAVSRAKSYIFSTVKYWKLKTEFLDHVSLLFRLAVSDFWNKLPLIRCKGPNAKLVCFLSHIFSAFISFLKYGEKNPSSFSFTYRDCQGLSNHIFYNFFTLTLSTVGSFSSDDLYLAELRLSQFDEIGHRVLSFLFCSTFSYFLDKSVSFGTRMSKIYQVGAIWQQF